MRLQQPCLLILGLIGLRFGLLRSLQVRLLEVLWALVVGSRRVARSSLHSSHVPLPRTKSVIEFLLRRIQAFHSPLLKGVVFQESVVEACDQVVLGWCS